MHLACLSGKLDMVRLIYKQVSHRKTLLLYVYKTKKIKMTSHIIIKRCYLLLISRIMDKATHFLYLATIFLANILLH